MNFIFIIMFICIAVFFVLPFMMGRRLSLISIIGGIIPIFVVFFLFNNISDVMCNNQVANTTAFNSFGNLNTLFGCDAVTVAPQQNSPHRYFEETGDVMIGDLNIDDDYELPEYDTNKYRYNKSDTLNMNILNDGTLLNLEDI